MRWYGAFTYIKMVYKLLYAHNIFDVYFLYMQMSNVERVCTLVTLYNASPAAVAHYRS